VGEDFADRGVGILLSRGDFGGELFEFGFAGARAGQSPVRDERT